MPKILCAALQTPSVGNLISNFTIPAFKSELSVVSLKVMVAPPGVVVSPESIKPSIAHGTGRMIAGINNHGKFIGHI